MKIVRPNITIVDKINGEEILDKIEKAARICYQSDPNSDTREKFLANIIKSGHTSVIEHEKISVVIICDRGCYDDETKVLTNHGWKLFKDVDIENDLIYTIDETGELKFVKAVNKIDYVYDGNLDHYHSSQIDLCVTPDHRMWLFDYEKRTEQSKTWKFIPSSEVKNGRYEFNKSSLGTQNFNLSEITIPSVSRTVFNHVRTYDGHVWRGNNINLFLELLGLWVTDGSVSFGTTNNDGSKKTGNRVCITQTKPFVRDRIMYILDWLGLRHYEYKNDIRISDPPLFDWLVENFIDGKNTRKTYYLTLPRWMFSNLSKYNIDCFLRGVFLGDGSRHSCRNRNHKRGFVVYTASKRFAEDLVELALLSGRCANIRTVEPRTRVFPNGHVSKCKEQYVVSFVSTNIHLFNNDDRHRYTKEYHGHVYCLELESEHRLYVMRNGKACWCGNCSHELVRHRIASYSQESTRYVNYKNKGMQFIRPITIVDKPELFEIWKRSCEDSEKSYEEMINHGARPQEARDVLNNSLKTQIEMTMNLRSYRNFFTLRCAKGAHPHMKEIAIALLMFFKERIPVIFDDIEYDEDFWNQYVASKNENWHNYVIDRELMEECGLA